MIRSKEDLQRVKEESLKSIELRSAVEDGREVQENPIRQQWLICRGTGCTSSGSDAVLHKMEEQIEKLGLEDVEAVLVGCLGYCGQGPIVKVEPDNVFYVHVQADDVEELMETHAKGGEVVERLLFKHPDTGEAIADYREIPFYKKQVRLALRNVGKVNPENINDYIAYGGYEALEHSINDLERIEVIEQMKESGLRGRGGAGFPAGRKWESAFYVDDDPKYVICNADEGDPGAFMDCSILEGDPHSVLEAMAILGYAIGSNQGYIYVRAEYPIAIQRLNIAIAQAEDMGVLGDNIFGSDFSFHIELRLGAGAFVCGEGTALMESIEGHRGMPRTKIHRTAVKGLWQKPTIINNVETLANVPYILKNGPEVFRKVGTDKSPGTKVFSLSGKIANNGLIEVPMGTPLREIIYDIGGGCADGKEFKAVQTGGPSGGCIPEDKLDVPVDFENLGALGAMMGSGGMVVMDEDNCMVDVARFFLDFTVDESCGKCTPCREGTKRMLEILERMVEGRGKQGDIEELEDLSEMIIDTSLCGLGQSAPNPVRSSLNYFRNEYEAHVDDKKCPAGACKALAEIFITDKCIGCTKCAKVCPVSCIDGKVKEQHVIRQEDCIKCETCIGVCPVKAIVKR